MENLGGWESSKQQWETGVERREFPDTEKNGEQGSSPRKLGMRFGN